MPTLTDATLQAMEAYSPNGTHLTTERMVQVLALIHETGTNPDAKRVSNMAKSMGALINEKVEQSRTGRDFATVLNDLKTGITQSTLMDNGPFKTQEQMLTVIRGMEMKLAAEKVLHTEMAQHPAYESFDTKECWRLTIDRIQDGRGEYGFENESGYLDGTFRGLALSLETVRNPQPLTPQMLTQIHATCVQDVFPMGVTMSAGDAGHLRTGTRDNQSNSFGLTDGENMSPKGLQQLRDKINEGDDWFSIEQNGDKLRVKTKYKTAQECTDRVKAIVDKYDTEILGSNTDDDKYTAIARCCRDLETSHIYRDGNARTIGFCLANKLLVENKLPPVIFENPNRFDGLSVTELVNEMKEGSVNFACHCSAPSIANPAQTPGQSCQALLDTVRREKRGANRVTENELLTAAGKNGNTAMITTVLNEGRAAENRIEPGEFDFQAEMAVAHARHPNSEAVKNDYRHVQVGQLTAAQAKELTHKAMSYSHDRLRANQTGSQIRVDGWNQLLSAMSAASSLNQDANLQSLVKETSSALKNMNSPVNAVKQQFQQAANAMDGPDLPARETTSTSGKLRAFFKPNAAPPLPNGAAYVPGKGFI